MPKFRVTYGGSEADGRLELDEQTAVDTCSSFEVSATSEADAVFEFNRELEDTPIAGEQYFVTRIVTQPTYLVTVTSTDNGLPVVVARPSSVQ